MEFNNIVSMVACLYALNGLYQVDCERKYPQDKDYMCSTTSNHSVLSCPTEDYVIYNISMRSKNNEYGCYGLQHTVLVDMLGCYLKPTCTINFDKHVGITSTVDQENNNCTMLIPNVLMYNFSCIQTDKLIILDRDDRASIDEGIILSHQQYPWHYPNPKVTGLATTSTKLKRPRKQRAKKYLWLEYIKYDIADNDKVNVNGQPWSGGIMTLKDKSVTISFTVRAGNKFSGFAISFKWLKSNFSKEFEDRPHPLQLKLNSGKEDNDCSSPLRLKSNLSKEFEDQPHPLQLKLNSGKEDDDCPSPLQPVKDCMMKIKKVTGKLRYTKGCKLTLKVKRPKDQKILWLGLKKSSGSYSYTRKKKPYSLQPDKLIDIDLPKNRKRLTIKLVLSSIMADDDYLCYHWGKEPKSCTDAIFEAPRVMVNKCKSKSKKRRHTN